MKKKFIPIFNKKKLRVPVIHKCASYLTKYSKASNIFVPAPHRSMDLLKAAKNTKLCGSEF